MIINVGIAGGPSTGKSTLAAALFAKLKINGFDYDLVADEGRKLRKEFGNFRSPFERFYMWRQQEREELRSTALDGFITDKPLYHFYAQAKQYVKEPRDNLAVRELFRMCMEIEEADRYQLIVMAKNPAEILYRRDQGRKSSEAEARKRHQIIVSFVEHFCPQKLFFVEGGVEERVAQVMSKLEKMRK